MACLNICFCDWSRLIISVGSVAYDYKLIDISFDMRLMSEFRLNSSRVRRFFIINNRILCDALCVQMFKVLFYSSLTIKKLSVVCREVMRKANFW